MDQYICDREFNFQKCDDPLVYAQWWEMAERHVENDYIDDIHVSTVFLGLDHGFGESQPVLFETMIFGGEHDQYCERYTNVQDAREGHQRALSMVWTSNQS